MKNKKIFLIIFLVIVLVFSSSSVFASYTITSEDDYLYSYTADRFSGFSYVFWEFDGNFFCIIPCERSNAD